MSRVSERRARKALELRSRLVKCAAALITTRGYEATTMEDIGECADVSRATVFNYFSRKEEIVLAWFDGRRSELAEYLAQSRQSPAGTVDELRRAFRALAHIFEVDPKTGQSMVRAWLQAGGPLLTPTSDTTHLLADIIRAGQERGDISSQTDADCAGLLLFDAYIGVLNRWAAQNHSPQDLEKNLLTVLEIVLRGIAAPVS